MNHCITHVKLIQSYTPTILQQKFLRLLKKHQAASLVERRHLSLKEREQKREKGKARRTGGRRTERRKGRKRKKRWRTREGSRGRMEGERSGGEERRGQTHEDVGAAVATASVPVAEPGFLQKGTWSSETAAPHPPPPPLKGLKPLSHCRWLIARLGPWC